MGPKKGKKAWKKIDTQDVDDYLEKSTREERQGLVFEGVPDADLFFVDKGEEPAAEGAAPAAGGKKAKKLTRAQAILEGAHKAKPVNPKAAPRKLRGAPLPPPGAAAGKVGASGAAKHGRPAKATGRQATAGGTFDLWADQPLQGAAAGTSISLAEPEGQAAKRRRVERGPGQRRLAAPAVEIDLPGCSFNPDKEQHQDAIAVAVAAEMQKIYKKDLEPVAPPTLVDYQPETDELNALLGEGGEGEENDEEAEATAGPEGGDAAGEAGAMRRQQKVERKTKKDRNREKRRREAEAEAAEKARLKAQRRQLEALKAIEGEVEGQLAEQEATRLRRQLDREERLASEPPKLGKLRFEPQPLQVLTTDEVTGSLRRLKPAAMLAKDRFKALQRRGMIEPRKKVAKKAGKKVLYEQGARWEREKEGQQHINEARKQLKKKKKQQKAGDS